MKLLLDTHIWLWSVLEPWKLSSEVHQELSSSRNELWLSPLGIWELVLLRNQGSVVIGSDLGEWVRRSFAELRLQEAPFTAEVALELPFVQLPHRIREIASWWRPRELTA